LKAKKQADEVYLLVEQLISGAMQASIGKSIIDLDILSLFSNFSFLADDVLERMCLNLRFYSEIPWRDP
jgi:hypothetical protein